jgi:hypothetical protein
MWGHPRPVVGAVDPFLEPFCGHLLQKVDRLCSKLTFEIPPRRALRGCATTLAAYIIKTMVNIIIMISKTTEDVECTSTVTPTSP